MSENEGAEAMIVFRCFLVQQECQIPRSSIDLSAWHLKGTTIASFIARGVTEFFIHTADLTPLLYFIHRAKNPGNDILEEICAPQKVMDMAKKGILTPEGFEYRIYFKEDDIIYDDAMVEFSIFFQDYRNNLEDLDKLEYFRTLDELYRLEHDEEPPAQTLDNLTIKSSKDYHVLFSYHLKPSFPDDFQPIGKDLTASFIESVKKARRGI